MSYFDSNQNRMIQKLFSDPNKDPATRDFLARFPNAVGSFGYDPWGFNLKTIQRFINLGRVMYEDYFRVEVQGFENIPKEGRCLIIANHTGQLPIDAILLGYAMVVNPVAPRAAKGMYERFIPTIPFFSMWFTQMGGALGDIENCEKMLLKDEAVIVFPEGARGISKHWKKRYQMERFGNGFMYMAQKTKSPIIPVGIGGCEETMINLGNLDLVEKWLRFPKAPVLLPFVFPSKVIINIGKPMYFEDHNDTELVLDAKVNEVKKEVKRLTDEALEIRSGKKKIRVPSEVQQFHAENTAS